MAGRKTTRGRSPRHSDRCESESRPEDPQARIKRRVSGGFAVAKSPDPHPMYPARASLPLVRRYQMPGE